jgi:hypothetical protein
MHRALYLAGIGYLAICAAVIFHPRRREATPLTTPGPVAVQFAGTANQWYAQIKPFCNAVEVEIAQRQHPAPPDAEGQGYSAACYALGGKIDLARQVIDRLPPSDRYRAAGIVFEIAHPVADAGDDRSAGPIMEMVIDYWPNNYMALYHAGMSEYALGQPDRARRHLQSFLALYHQDDGWRHNAVDVLGRLH